MSKLGGSTFGTEHLDYKEITTGGGGGSCDYPAAINVRDSVVYGGGIGTLTLPAPEDVESGVQYGADGTEFTGTFTCPPAVCDYPAEADVQSGVVYNSGANTGTFLAPSEDDVQSGVTFGSGAEFTGNFVVPTEAQVASGVSYGASGTEFTGTLVASGATQYSKSYSPVDPTKSLSYASSNAAHLHIITASTDITLQSVSALLKYDTGATYKCLIAEVNSGNTITAIIGDSGNRPIHYTTTIGVMLFDFPSSVTLTSGGRYAIIINRTDGTGASPIQMAYTLLGTAPASTDLTHLGYTSASVVNPGVGYDFPSEATTLQYFINLYYTT